ncbi:MAG: DNRLRE domain-containing protein [Nanoarchaeota archaeon]|nr:DNRLRE domain-containing protein [Nanoarchaeota archaeon]
MKKLVLIVLTFVALFGCKKENSFEKEGIPVGPSGEELFEISSGEVLSYSDEGTISLSGTSGISVGDFIVTGFSSSTPMGFLKKVKSVSGGKIHTQQASIEEVVKDGSLSFSKEIKPSEKYKSSLPEGVTFIEKKGFDFGFNFNNIQISNGVFINGQFFFNYSVDGEIDIEKWKLKKFLIINILSEESSLQISANDSFYLQDKEKIIWSQNLPGFLAGTIGIVPLYITPSIEVVLKADGSISVCSSKVNQSFELQGGLKYENNKWDMIKSLDFDFSGFNPSLQSNLSLEAYASAAFNIFLYDVAGPYAYADGGLGVYASSSGGSINWNLDGKLKIGVGAKIKILSKTLADKNYNLINYDEQILSGQIGGTNNPPTVFIQVDTPEPWYVGNEISFKAAVVDEVPEDQCQVRWDFEDNGVWDTDWVYEKTMIHSFPNKAYYVVKVQAKDPSGKIGEKTRGMNIVTPNNNSIILQPGPEGKDASAGLVNWVSGNTTYYGDGTTEEMEISKYVTGGSEGWRSMLIQFPLDEIPENSTIVSAKMELYGFGLGPYPNLAIARISKVTSPWEENSVNGENFPSSENYFTSFEFTFEGIKSWYSIDISSVVQSWILDPSQNNGLALSTVSNDTYCLIFSSDNPEVINRPKLIVEYY